MVLVIKTSLLPAFEKGHFPQTGINSGSNLDDSPPPNGTFGSLETFLAVTTAGITPASCGQRSGMQINTLQYTGQAPIYKIIRPQMAAVAWLRNRALKQTVGAGRGGGWRPSPRRGSACGFGLHSTPRPHLGSPCLLGPSPPLLEAELQ